MARASPQVSRRRLVEAGGLMLLVPGLPGCARAASGDSAVAPPIAVVTLGAFGHGKTTLATALGRQFGGTPPVASQKLPGLDLRLTEYRTAARRYAHADGARHRDHVAGLITGAAAADGAILVVSAQDGPTQETEAHVRLARQTGVPAMVVYLNKIDAVTDPELLELIELEVRELLSSYGFPGDLSPVVKGSALDAVTGRRPQIGEASIRALAGALDAYLPQPEPLREQPFRMPVEDVFSISGRGTVVTGRVETGALRPGDALELVGIRPTQSTRCVGVEMFQEQPKSVQAGDVAGVLLERLDRHDIERGQTLCAPGAMAAAARFTAEVYVPTSDDGGRVEPIADKRRLQFFFRTADITGVVALPQGTAALAPGKNAELTVALIVPVAMEPHMRFAIRERGRIVGSGVVTKILA
jgi:elongation factor Tu